MVTKIIRLSRVIVTTILLSVTIYNSKIYAGFEYEYTEHTLSRSYGVLTLKSVPGNVIDREENINCALRYIKSWAKRNTIVNVVLCDYTSEYDINRVLVGFFESLWVAGQTINEIRLTKLTRNNASIFAEILWRPKVRIKRLILNESIFQSVDEVLRFAKKLAEQNGEELWLDIEGFNAVPPYNPDVACDLIRQLQEEIREQNYTVDTVTHPDDERMMLRIIYQTPTTRIVNEHNATIDYPVLGGAINPYRIVLAGGVAAEGVGSRP